MDERGGINYNEYEHKESLLMLGVLSGSFFAVREGSTPRILYTTSNQHSIVLPSKIRRTTVACTACKANTSRLSVKGLSLKAQVFKDKVQGIIQYQRQRHRCMLWTPILRLLVTRVTHNGDK